jgi:hypothetical protein
MIAIGVAYFWQSSGQAADEPSNNGRVSADTSELKGTYLKLKSQHIQLGIDDEPVIAGLLLYLAKGEWYCTTRIGSMDAVSRRRNLPRVVILEIKGLCEDIYAPEPLHLELKTQHDPVEGGLYARQEAKGGYAEEWQVSGSRESMQIVTFEQVEDCVVQGTYSGLGMRYSNESRDIREPTDVTVTFRAWILPQGGYSQQAYEIGKNSKCWKPMEP